MNPDFNFSQFQTQYELKDAINRLCSALSQTRTPNNQPALNTAAGTPLNNLLRTLQIDSPAPAPNFLFELNDNISIDAVKDACATHNVSFFDVQKSAAGRTFYNASYNQPNVAENWREFSRPEAADTNVELDRISFLAGSKTIVEWSESLPRLKKLFKQRVYTADMAKDCLMKLVHKFHSEQSILLSSKTADEIATHLLKLDTNRDKSVFYRALLLQAYRMPDEDLPAAMARIQIIIDKCYDPANIAFTAHRSTAYRTALISFLPDQLASHVLAHIQKRFSDCEPLSDPDLFHFATKCEEYAKCRPSTNLIFGRQINNQPAASYLQLNSMQPTSNSTYQVYNPYQSHYQAYPAYLPLQSSFPAMNPMQHAQQQVLAPPIIQNAPQPIIAPPMQLPAMSPMHQAIVSPHRMPLHSPRQLQPIVPQPMGNQPFSPFPASLDNQGRFPPNQPILQPHPIPPPHPILSLIPDPTILADAVSPSQSINRPTTSPTTSPGAVALDWEDISPQEEFPDITYLDIPSGSRIFHEKSSSYAEIQGNVYRIIDHPNDNTQSTRSTATNRTPVTTGTAPRQRTLLPSRSSSRETRKPDRYQASFNSVTSTRGQVDNQGRYTIHDKSTTTIKTPSRPTSKSPSHLQRPSNTQIRSQPVRNDSRTRNFSQQSRSPSQTRNRDRSQSRDRPTYNPYRSFSRSKSPYNRSPNPPQQYNYSNTRASRSPAKSNSFRSANRSASTRRTYPQMQKGINCRPDYDPTLTKSCTKCMKPNHHEFECSKYFTYNHRKCTFCLAMNHETADCQESTPFPPKQNQKN
jgi:hypothetical protein